MHLFEGEKIRIFHHGDYSGEVHIVLSEKVNQFSTIQEIDAATIIVPASDLFDFVAVAVMRQRISKLEQMKPEEILGIRIYRESRRKK